MKADFFVHDDKDKFETLAPTLAKNDGVIGCWGVLNVAQVAQENGLADGAWSLDYLCEAFRGTTGISYMGDVIHAELDAIWKFAYQAPR